VKSLELELPDQVAAELDELVKAGLYHNAQEAIRHALKEFLRAHASTLAKQHQREDIAWALRDAPRNGF
jgi:Arc/MetJ-type ribon-helix-helix transcriptional regulator